jgi:hypothetical protein
MKEKTLEELKAERQALADKLLGASEKSEEEFADVCREAAMHFFASLQVVLNPTPEPLAFLAIFALETMADNFAKSAPGARKEAERYASIVSVESTAIKFPRFLRKEDEE